MSSRQDLGRWGEKIAADYLNQQRYTILDRNVRTPHGEIDLVVQREEVTIFIEVKTRTSTAYGLPEDAVTLKKQAHLLDSAQAYLQLYPELDGDWRVDVIAIRRFYGDQSPEIIHFENAFN